MSEPMLGISIVPTNRAELDYALEHGFLYCAGLWPHDPGCYQKYYSSQSEFEKEKAETSDFAFRTLSIAKPRNHC